MQKTIKRLTIYNSTIQYTVGYGGVSEIIDNTSEFADSIHHEYLIIDENGKVIASIQDCPAIIDYM